MIFPRSVFLHSLTLMWRTDPFLLVVLTVAYYSIIASILPTSGRHLLTPLTVLGNGMLMGLPTLVRSRTLYAKVLGVTFAGHKPASVFGKSLIKCQ